MRIPVVRGIIDRRILANYRVDAEVMGEALPPPFRPQLVGGYAVGGICLIRLKRIRPKLFPIPWGIGSENAAHRIAVEWDVDGQTRSGVYIPRRDTNSLINSLAGGRVFPGVHHHATFAVVEQGDDYSVTMTSDDGTANVHVSGRRLASIPASSVFGNLESASDFFKMGALGYSDTHVAGKYDGLELACSNWSVESLDVERIHSSYFEDEQLFPKGSVEFDCALLMRDVEHEWHGRADLCCTTGRER